MSEAEEWFDREVAALYEYSRPGYPDRLFRDVLDYCRPQQGDRFLEVGAGTGKATRPFAALGYAIDALEPSPAMAMKTSTCMGPTVILRIDPTPAVCWSVEQLLEKLPSEIDVELRTQTV